MNKGNILIFSLFTTSILFFIGIALIKLCIISSQISDGKLKALKTFCLAEAGIEEAKLKIKKDNLWFTDNIKISSNKGFLISSTKGEIFFLKDGGYKIIKDKNRNIIYSVGFLGNEIIDSTSYSFIKIKYELPFKQIEWEKY